MKLPYPWWAKATTYDHNYCNLVRAQAKGRTLDVLNAIASGLPPQEVAAQLCISKDTVETYINRLLELCHKAWGIGPDIYLDYCFLYAKFHKELCKISNTANAAIDTQEKERCDQVMAQVRGRERDILCAIGVGWRPQEIATQFKISTKTVYTYTPKLLMHSRNVWNIRLGVRIDYRFLYIKFAHYLDQQNLGA